MNYEIGKITKDIIEILNLDYNEEKTIYIGESNINHIKEKHFEDYIKYGNSIKEILESPTYLARNERKNSIEFIKKYKIKNDYVMVVVRVSKNNINFVRTMYIMDKIKVEKYFRHHYFYPYNT
ncbi:MAG: PBECR2 nuclease fold domain-containing protein [Clostridia bacterium]